MAKFSLKCPACEEAFAYKPFARGAAEHTCTKCGAKSSISVRFTIWIMELLLFYIYINQIQPTIMNEASVPTILIGMLAFCGGVTLIICGVLNHFVGTGFLFEVKKIK